MEKHKRAHNNHLLLVIKIKNLEEDLLENSSIAMETSG